MDRIFASREPVHGFFVRAKATFKKDTKNGIFEYYDSITVYKFADKSLG
jgi:hypothetical protein